MTRPHLERLSVRQIDFRGIDPACDCCCEPLGLDDDCYNDTDRGYVYCSKRCARAHDDDRQMPVPPRPVLPTPAPFTLARESARGPKPAHTFDDNLPKPRQGKLFAGTDCLPGQGELFNPNGPKEPRS